MVVKKFLNVETFDLFKRLNVWFCQAYCSIQFITERIKVKYLKCIYKSLKTWFANQTINLLIEWAEFHLPLTYCSHCIAVILTWLRWFAIIVIFVHGGFRMIFLNGEFIIVVIWLNRQCYLVIHPALSSHPQKQALKYQDTMLFPQKWFHCITGGKAVELHRKQIPCGWTIFN